MSSTEIDTSGQAASLLWLDFEFTGLNIDEDIVVEAGLIATDYSLREVASFTTFINYPADQVEELMSRNPWWQDRPAHQATMLEGVRSSPNNLAVVGSEIASFARSWCAPPVILSGNSIHNDRKWVDRDFPELSQVLHYRMVDVSTVKLLASGMLGIEFDKKESHRALDDIEESIEELKFLLSAMGSSDIKKILGHY